MSCPYSECGGCINCKASPDEIFKHKNTNLASVLGLEVSNLQAIRSPRNEGYRIRTLLRYNPSTQNIGYFAHGTRDLINIDRCLTVSDKINDVITWLKNNPLVFHTDERFRILLQQCILQNQIKVSAYVVGSNGKSKTLADFCRHLELCPDVVSASDPSELNPMIFQYDEQQGLKFHYTPAEFRQTNTDINRIIRLKVQEWLSDAKSIYDFYGGSGNLSLLLTKNSIVKVYEHSHSSAHSAEANMTYNQIPENIFNWSHCNLDSISWNKRPWYADAVIVDPPRAGLSDQVIDALNAHPVNKIVYLSCHPLTLAFDLAKLNVNYDLQEIIHLDMMPRTTHTEVLCLLQSKC